MIVNFKLNGKSVNIESDPMRRLLDVLREDLKTTGVKEGCGEGECGACSVLLNGRIVNSCIVPLAAVEGASVTTIEGLRETERGKAIIEAYAEEGSVQCGFCIPGMVIATESLLNENPQPLEDQIREALSGNLCRCTGYDMIIRGVKRASENGAGLW